MKFDNTPYVPSTCTTLDDVKWCVRLATDEIHTGTTYTGVWKPYPKGGPNANKVALFSKDNVFFAKGTWPENTPVRVGFDAFDIFGREQPYSPSTPPLPEPKRLAYDPVPEWDAATDSTPLPCKITQLREIRKRVITKTPIIPIPLDELTKECMQPTSRTRNTFVYWHDYFFDNLTPADRVALAIFALDGLDRSALNNDSLRELVLRLT